MTRGNGYSHHIPFRVIIDKKIDKNSPPETFSWKRLVTIHLLAKVVVNLKKVVADLVMTFVDSSYLSLGLTQYTTRSTSRNTSLENWPRVAMTSPVHHT